MNIIVFVTQHLKLDMNPNDINIQSLPYRKPLVKYVVKAIKI